MASGIHNILWYTAQATHVSETLADARLGVIRRDLCTSKVEKHLLQRSLTDGVILNVEITLTSL